MTSSLPSPNLTERELRINNLDAAATVYADGMVQLGFGYPNSRLVLATSTAQTPTHDDRKVEVVLVMPTTSLLEMCSLILSNAKASSPSILGYSQQAAEQLSSHLAAIEIASFTPVPHTTAAA